MVHLSFICYSWPVHNQFEIALAKTFAQRGIETKFVVIKQNHKMLYGSEMLFKFNSLSKHNIEELTVNIFNQNYEFLTKLAPEFSIFNPSEILEERLIDSVANVYYERINEWLCKKESNSNIDERSRRLLSVLNTRFRVSSIKELVDVQEISIIRESLQSIAYTYAYGKAAAEAVINKLNTETTTASLYNGRFAIYAGIFDGLVNNIKNIAVHERGHKKGSFKIMLNTTLDDHLTSNQTITHYANNYPLDKSQRDTLKEFQVKRRARGQDNQLNFQGTKSVDLSSITNNPAGMVSLFTSSLDETTIFLKSETYDNYERYLHNLIKYINFTGSYLVVRHHPNLGKIGSPCRATRFLDRVRDICSSLDNILIVEPEDNLHWTWLADRSYLNIVPHSSLLIDMRYWGYNVVTPSECFAYQSLQDNHDLLFKQFIEKKSQNKFQVSQLMPSSKLLLNRQKLAESYSYYFYIGSSFSTKLVQINAFRESINSSLLDGSESIVCNNIDSLCEKMSFTRIEPSLYVND